MTPIDPISFVSPWIACRWIPCSERLPELHPDRGYSESVLVFAPKCDEPFIAYRGGVATRWMVVGEEDDIQPEVTHWMPLPPGP